MGIEHASMKSHISQEVRIQKFCTYPSGIEHAGTSLPFSPTYPMGIEYVGTVEEVEIEIETKVNPRQEPH